MGNSVVNSTEEQSNTDTISHSLIKSLNIFNSITRDDTKKINTKLLDMNTWFQNLNNKINMSRNKSMLLSPEDTKPVSKILNQANIQEEVHTNEDVPRLSSPHHIQSLQFDHNTNSIIIDSETTGKQDLFITANPSPIMQRTPKNTKSINISVDDALETNISNLDKTQTSIPNKTKDEDEPSPWSPYKVEKSLKNADIPFDQKDKSIISNHSISLIESQTKITDGHKKEQDFNLIKEETFKEEVSEKSISSKTVPDPNVVKDEITGYKLLTEDIKQENNTSIRSQNSSISKSVLSNSSMTKTATNSTKHSPNKPIKTNIRVNMFAPLPEKDPLIVKNSSLQPLVSRSNNNTLKFQSIASTTGINTKHNNNSNPLLESKPPLSKSNTSPYSITGTKATLTPRSKTNAQVNPYSRIERRSRISPQKTNKLVSPSTRNGDSSTVKGKIRSSKSPPSKLLSKTPSRTYSNPMRSGGVFDRLSSIPTKSFEQKIRQRTGSTPVAPRRHNPSSIDVTGSPLKRISPQHKKANQSEILEQEALNSIFFKNKDQERQSPLRKERVSTKQKDNSSLSTNKSTQVYDSLIPKLDHITHSNNVKTHYDLGLLSTNPSQVTNKIESPVKTESKTNKSINDNGIHAISPTKSVSNLSPSTQKIIITPTAVEKSKHTSTTHISLTSLNPNEKIPATSVGPTTLNNEKKIILSSSLDDNKKQESNEIISTTDKQLKDATSNIQLIPSVEHGKDDVKTKLNKRLSQVIRTQQEQEKKRKENQQKRKKSQLEDDLRRKKTRYSNYKMYSKKRSLSTNTDHLSKSAYHNANVSGIKNNGIHTKLANDPSIDTSNILGDIDRVDYRNIIGGDTTQDSNKIAPPAQPNPIGEDSLPEIPSDDEIDHDVMADWAQAPALENQLKVQQSWDPKKIFGPIAPLHIDEIFPNSSTSRLSKVKSKITKKSSWKT